MEIQEALTFDDVTIVPRKTTLNSRSEANLKTKFTKNVSLNIPLVSANMASVTESKMAIAMAREGGIGIIHQFGTIEDEVREIKKVKRSTSYVIDEPVCVSPNITLGQAIDTMKNENVTSLLVKDNDDLVGIFTSRDYLFQKEFNRKLSDFMTPKDKLITASYGISIEEAKQIFYDNKIEKLPLLDSSDKLKGLMTTKDIMKIEHWPDACRDKKGRLQVGAAVGVKNTLERAEACIKAGADVLVLDIAHGHSDAIIKCLKELDQAFPQIDVMVGNIVTAEAAEELISAGARGLKVGVGPSRVCSTRLVSGAGIPQFTSTVEVYEVAKRYGVPVCTDGGFDGKIGNIGKALAAGASSVMSGSFFAGADESPARMTKKDGRDYKVYFGSASYDSAHNRKELEMKKKINERFDTYVEGVTNLVHYIGPVDKQIKEIVKGINSSMSYCGATNVEEMQSILPHLRFRRNTAAGIREASTRGDKLSE